VTAATWDEHDAYSALADELNDVGVEMTVDDFDTSMVAAARRYAERHALRFPPSTGDFDRLWEREHNRSLSPSARTITPQYPTQGAHTT
jgi:hypothetical protein